MNLPHGFTRNMPFADYQKIPALNYSTLKVIERSPFAYKYFLDNPAESTPAQKLGHWAHTAILEPNLSNFAIWTGGIRNSNAYKMWAEERESAGKTVINEKERDYIAGIASAVRANPDAAKYLRHAATELTMVWRDPTLKRHMKARIDALAEIAGDPVMISLKTTTNCGTGRLGFGYQYANLGYAAQDALYQDGYICLNHELPKMVTIAVDNKPPFETAVYVLPIRILRAGQQKLQSWVERLNECEKKNEWPGAVEGEQELQFPPWAMPEGDFMFDDLEMNG